MISQSSISFVVPVYNAALYLREALASLRWQTARSWECVCVNDGSTDDSGEILDQFAAGDERFRVIHQQNQGIVSALNRGVRAASGDWIAIMHADDVALPKRLEVQREYLRQHGDCVAVGSDMLCIDPNGMPIERQRSGRHHEEIERLLLRGKNTMNHPTVLMRREAAVAVGLYRQEYEWVEDADLWLRLARVGRLANIPQVLLKYRQHEASLTWSRSAAVCQRLQMLVVDARRERQLPETAGAKRSWRPPGRPSPSAAKWARRAARAGYFRTAKQHLQRLQREQPYSLLAAKEAIEYAYRRMRSIGRARRPSEIQTPDWRQWNCAPEPTARMPRPAA